MRALSTTLSTNALDKNPQSQVSGAVGLRSADGFCQERGITLDLGFSSFVRPIPEHLGAAEGAQRVALSNEPLTSCGRQDSIQCSTPWLIVPDTLR